MDFLTDITAYHWFALGLILLIAEMLGASGFLLGAGVAALGMGVVLWMFPDMSGSAQILLFSLSAVAATISYFKVFKDALADQGRPLLNKRAKRLIGHQFELEKDVNLGEAKVQIGDTMWKVVTDQPLSQGTIVEVVDTDRMSLIIVAKHNTATAAIE